jgi:hypothetical protein
MILGVWRNVCHIPVLLWKIWVCLRNCLLWPLQLHVFMNRLRPNGIGAGANHKNLKLLSSTSKMNASGNGNNAQYANTQVPT